MFKVEDRVVIVRIDPNNIHDGVLNGFLGTVQTITAIDLKWGHPYSIGPTSFSEEELVLEEVYNSPLYQSLREIE